MTGARWRKPSRCESAECAEVRPDGDRIWLRNSTRPHEHLEFPADTWRTFIAAVRADEFRPGE